MAKIKECWSCGAYRAYYTKGLFQFDKQNIGHCKKYNCLIEDKHHTCEFWKNDYTIKNLRKSFAIKKINEVADCLLQIKQILSEEKEEIEMRETTGLRII